MYTPYADLTIGTIAGVNKKIGSPSLALQLTAATTLSYAVASVDTVTSVIATQQPNGMATNDSIQFIGNSLPAPLVTATTYYAIFSSSTALKVSLTSGGSAITLTTTGTLPMQVQNLSSVDNAVQAVINDTKVNYLANALDVHFKTIMPDTIDRWINQRQEWFHAWSRRANLDTLPVFGFYGGSNYDPGQSWLLAGQEFRPSDSIGVMEPPYTWFFIGPVVNGSIPTATLLNTANNGDRAYDTLNNTLFINRGTSADVDWQIQTYEDVKDYLINPSVLSEAHNYLAAAKCFELGVSRNVTSYSDTARRDYFLEREEYCMNKYLDALYGSGDEKGRRSGNGVLKLVQTDYSNSGSYTEFSRKITPEDVWTV